MLKSVRKHYIDQNSGGTTTIQLWMQSIVCAHAHLCSRIDRSPSAFANMHFQLTTRGCVCVPDVCSRAWYVYLWCLLSHRRCIPTALNHITYTTDDKVINHYGQCFWSNRLRAMRITCWTKMRRIVPSGLYAVAIVWTKHCSLIRFIPNWVAAGVIIYIYVQYESSQ